MIALKRPLVTLDIEGTGLDTSKDRIVSVALVKLDPGHLRVTLYREFNPGRPIPPKVENIIGFSDTSVQHLPAFEKSAQELFDFLLGCDLAGYNLLNYDIPLLVEEFHRTGLDFSIDGRAIIDAGNIFKKKEARTLEAAVEFYTGQKFDRAHHALHDADATLAVLEGQLTRYPDLLAMDAAQLAEFSRFDRRLDLAGKILIDQDGDPIYNLGNNRGQKVKDDVSFACWMLGKDFPRQTLKVLSGYLDQLEREEAETREDEHVGADVYPWA